MSTGKRKLNHSQVAMLSQLYKYRFGNRELLAASSGKANTNAVYSKLSILEAAGYIAKRFDKSYKFAGRSAEYYLLPKGMRELRQYAELDGLYDTAIKATYNDHKRSEPFVQRHLAVFRIANKLASYSVDISLYTKRELAAFEYFPKQLPDGFITIKTNDKTSHYFLELFMSDEPPFATDGRMRKLITYYEDNDWSVAGTAFPIILCVAETNTIERRLIRQIRSRLNRSDTDMAFYVTSLKALLNSVQSDTIWSDIDEPDELLELSKLL